MSFGLNGSTITGSVAAAGGAQTAISGVVVSNTTYTSGTISFSNANGLSFGSSAGQAITGSYTVPGSTNFSNSNNVSFGLNGSTITATATLPLQTGVSGIVVSNTTYTSGTVSFSNLNGISFGSVNATAVSASYTVPSTAGLISALAVSAGAGTSNALTGITFQNSNGITFGLSTGASVGSMTASYNSTSAVGPNTAQTNVTWTVNSSGISINAAGYAGTATAITGMASITLNSAGLSFNGSNLVGTGTTITGGASITHGSAGISFNGVALAGTGTAITGAASITLNTTGLSFNGSGLAGTNTAITGTASITLNSAGLSFNGSNIAGVNTGTGSTTGGMAFAANSSGITISTPYLTRFIAPVGKQLTAITAPTNASQTIVYCFAPLAVTATRVDMLMQISASSSATTNTCAVAFSQYAIIYTKNASTLSSLSSGSTQTTYTFASNTAGATYLSQGAVYPISMPVNVNMAPGEYYVGVNFITATSSIGLSTTNNPFSFSIMGANDIQTASNYAEFAATATSTNLWGGMGVYSAATTGVVTRVSLSAINQTGANLSAANIALVFRNA